MFYYPVTFGSLLMGFLIVWIFGRTDYKEELNAEARAALDEFHRISKEFEIANQKETERIHNMWVAHQQQQDLLAQIEALKDDLPKEIEIKIGDQ